MSESLYANDGERIEATNHPADITERFLEISGDSDLLPFALEHLASGEDGWESAQHISSDLALSGSMPWADLAAALDHCTSGARFRWLAAEVVRGCYRRAEHSTAARLTQTAATLGFKLARLTAESDFARECGGEVAGIELEGESVDLTCDGATVQVFTSGADDPNNWNAKTDYKYDNRDEVPFDYFVVLHIKDDGTFGVGVEKMDEEKDDRGAHLKARDA